MVALPRIITVDPTGSLAHIIRAVSDLLDRSITLIDISSGPDALAEVRRGDCAVLVTTVELEDKIRGYQLAIEVSQISPDTRVIVLAESTDPELDVKELADSPYIYLHRPVDLNQFARVIVAALDGGDIFEAAQEPIQAAASPNGVVHLGQMPFLDAEAARPIIDTLLTDVGAMAIVFANRAGEVLLERGAVGYVDREQLTNVLLPTIHSVMDISTLVGGRTSALQVFDGDTYDIYVLSVGYHHFMCLIFDGQAGGRQLGAVNRYGRRAAEDMIALIGATALQIDRPSKSEIPVPVVTEPEEETIEPAAVRAEEWGTEPELPEPEPLKLDPIENLDLDLFDHKQLAKLDVNLAEDLFNPDTLAEIANETRRDRGPLSYDEARELGIIP